MSAPVERWECPNCGTPLNIASLGIYAKVACPACGHLDHVHTMLANFRIEGVLGLGGMSVVLRARDLVLERPLAIKLLNEFYRDRPERIARFEQECELMAKVRHENVVSVYSAGRVRGQFYIAMELVNGRNLEELVREQGPMEPARALDVLSQVVKGLDAAGKAGLLHRDMKPGNILICEDGHAKVLDFGLSLGKRDADTEEIIWATPFYVPPETLRREAEDSRTDIYALGMTLRHLLTGQENFDPVPADIDEMLECKRNLLHMAEVQPSLPEAYSDLIDHMTAYDPAARPENYASLMEEINEVRAALAEEGAGMPFSLRVKRALPMLAGAALTLASGAGVAAIIAHVATPEPELLYATPSASLSWPECETLAAAMGKLRAGETREAASLMTSLADSEGESTACAWAALHGELLAALHGEDELETARLRERFSYHLTRTPVSAGQDIFGQMKSLSEPDSAPEHPFLRVLSCLRRLDAADSAEAQKHGLHAFRTSLIAAGLAYVPLRNMVSEYEKRLASRLPEDAATLYSRSLAQLDVAGAGQALARLEAEASDADAKTRLSVQKEALALFSEAVEMMKRKSLMPAKGEEVTAATLQTLLAPLNEPELASELATLLLVAQGEFDEAAALNPYAKITNAPEPFAVMMRDWLSRVRGEPMPAENGEWADYADIED